MEWAVRTGRDKRLPSDARHVLVALADFANHRHGMAWASRAEIMDATGLSAHRVVRGVKAIEAAGIVGMARKPHGILWGPFPTLPHRVDNSVDARQSRGSVANSDARQSRGGARTPRGYAPRAARKPPRVQTPTPAPRSGPEDEPCRVDVHATVARIKSQIGAGHTLGPSEVVTYEETHGCEPELLHEGVSAPLLPDVEPG
jgi:hypothetical protein